TGIAGLFTGAVEKLEIVSLYAQPQRQQNSWQITVMVRNTGTTTATIDNIFINGIPINVCIQQNAIGNLQSRLRGQIQNINQNPLSIDPGQTDDITFDINMNSNCQIINFNPGVSIEVKLHTSGGKEYPKLVTLP
ncbi:MAG: hypothetical protein QXR12_00770, partial [Thermofilum sp.]